MAENPPKSELFRALGALIEAPQPALEPLAELLELGPLPSPAEHTELFTLKLYPYASVYLGAEGMLGGEARDRIAGFWRVLDLTPPPEPDHLTVMLAGYAELSAWGSPTGSPNGATQGATQGAAQSSPSHQAAWQRARRVYLWEHLLSWLPFYLDKLLLLAPPFYCKWGKMLHLALHQETIADADGLQLPLPLREAPTLPDPRGQGSALAQPGMAEAFLSGLLCPVRSGIILVRDDLSHAARELGLGTRRGERRLMLRTLLGQDPAATLSWLAALASSWAERHHQHGAQLGPIAQFWTGRATAAAAMLNQLGREASAVLGESPGSGPTEDFQT